MQPILTPSTLNRIQRNWLSVSERRVLQWLCARMPTFITPDRLTSIGMVGAVMVFVGYLASNVDVAWLFLSIVGYVVQWFGDSMDGSLARYRNIERPAYGYFIDHSCDGLTNLLIAAGIGLSPFVNMGIAMFALAGYLLMSIHVFLVARVNDEMRLSYLSIGPTELRLILIAMTAAMIFIVPAGDNCSVYIFDIIVFIIGSILVSLFIVKTLSIGRWLRRQGGG